MPPKITLTDAPTEALLKPLGTGLKRFNELRSGGPSNHRPLLILISDPVTGEGLGGLFGHTSHAYLHVDLLFIPESLRGSGLGRQILLQAEQEAIDRGCHAVWLDTFSFQARGFYERLGYSAFGTLEDYPPGHSRIFLTKQLAKL